ncbi:craniofacial development protein 2-like [Portunus trituberculatus]|uniref:craniofacial development protein 2-like n=1 Tax=Portunus trituberculatus TaxID=210409 RepID=UPI001E1CE1AA|nr:craniofacial development protein 2-like [Portunus trituberculatus]
MERSQNCRGSNAKAYPESDAQELRLTPVENVRGLPCQGQARLKKKTHTRNLKIGSINVGSMTGKGRELVDMLERRRVEICCIQETRWRGNKAKPLGKEYKLIYSGADAGGRNGVGVILNRRWQESVIEVIRLNDRIIKVKVTDHGITISIISAYAPQRGCPVEEKEEFWRQMDSLIPEVPENERIVLGGDLNGHIGQENANIQRVHGGWGVKIWTLNMDKRKCTV